MNTLEINNYLKNFPQFEGTYPRDMLPKMKKLPYGIVINTDPSNKQGEHWVAMYIDINGVGEYFDSFGLPPLHKEIVSFLDKNWSKGWLCNTLTFQSIFSETCGMYCVLYLSSRFRGMSFKRFTATFNHRSELNDRVAEILYKERVWS